MNSLNPYPCLCMLDGITKEVPCLVKELRSTGVEFGRHYLLPLPPTSCSHSLFFVTYIPASSSLFCTCVHSQALLYIIKFELFLFVLFPFKMRYNSALVNKVCPWLKPSSTPDNMSTEVESVSSIRIRRLNVSFHANNAFLNRSYIKTYLLA